MKQLTQEQITSIIEEIKSTQYVRDRSSHPWVTEDGVYDDEYYLTRNFIWNGFCYYTASKMWVDDQEANKRLHEWMRAPWGSYPSMPPKPPKKK